MRRRLCKIGWLIFGGRFSCACVLDILFVRTWWSYELDHGLAYSVAYHWFNLVEGCVWLVLAALVLVRYATQRQSQVELWYSFAFFTFGITDFREAYVQSSWLLWLKVANLVCLLYLRKLVIKRFYPSSKVF